MFDTLFTMPSLTDSDRLFIEQRRSRRKTGLYVLPALLIALVLLWVALFVWFPMAINPNAILGASETDLMRPGTGTLTRYALAATVLVNVLLLMLVSVCVIGISRAGRERRYVRMIDRLLKEQALSPPRVPAEAAQPVRQ
jgi:hypothetical protein